jgi:hypothetical protein
LAKTYLTDPDRVVGVLSSGELTPEHFSDPVGRDVIRQLRPGILALNLEGEHLNALRILARFAQCKGNLEELVEHLCALGPVSKLEAS